MGVKSIINKFSRRNLPCLFFLHIAKCGGISLNRALRWKYLGQYSRLSSAASVNAAMDICKLEHPFDDYYTSVHRNRNHILYYEMNRGYQFISGHYAYNHELHEGVGSKYVYMLLLRDPVDRFLSSYYFNKQKEESSPWKINETLEGYLESNTAIYHGQDYARLIAGVPFLEHDVNTQVNKGKEHLSRFDILGVIEEPNKIEVAIKEKLGVKVSVGHKNRTNQRIKVEELDSSLQKKINEICAPNIEIYKEALELLNQK